MDIKQIKHKKALHKGIIAGAIPPILTAFIFYKYNKIGLGDDNFIEYLFETGMLTKLISLFLVPNLLVFFIFIWLNRNQEAKGVIVATVFYGLLIVILKFM